MLTYALFIICEGSCRQASLSKQPVGTRSKALKHMAYTCLQVPYIANVLNGAVLLEIALRIPDFLALSQSSESFHYMETKICLYFSTRSFTGELPGQGHPCMGRSLSLGPRG